MCLVTGRQVVYKHGPLSFIIQPVFNSSDSPLITVYYQSWGILGNCVECFAEVKVNAFHASPLVHKCYYFIIEENQVGQAWFILGISTLTVPNHLLLLCVPKIHSKGTNYMIFPRTQVRVIGPSLLDFWTSWKWIRRKLQVREKPIVCKVSYFQLLFPQSAHSQHRVAGSVHGGGKRAFWLPQVCYQGTWDARKEGLNCRWSTWRVFAWAGL